MLTDFYLKNQYVSILFVLLRFVNNCLILIKSNKLYLKIVGTAWYRMMPHIELLDNDIKGSEAILLQSCFPKGVIGLKSIKGTRILFINI